jgi:hypothetical protein
MKSQTQLIKNYLEAGNSITPIEALNLFGCFRLSARIKDLRDQGLYITTENIKQNGKTFAKYSMDLVSSSF